jgi:hypothetical protein
MARRHHILYDGVTASGGVWVMRVSGMVVLALAIVLNACAQQPTPRWTRVDGKAIRGDVTLETQYEVDVKICQGEMQKANLSATAEAGFGRGRAVDQVFIGCMAQRGYVQRAVGP